MLYASDETGAYHQTIFTATADFFAVMQQKAAAQAFKKYDSDGADVATAANKAGNTERIQKVTLWTCRGGKRHGKKFSCSG